MKFRSCFLLVNSHDSDLDCVTVCESYVYVEGFKEEKNGTIFLRTNERTEFDMVNYEARTGVARMR